MKNNIVYKIMVLVCTIAILTACSKNYLYDGTTTEGNITEAQVWENNDYTRGVLNNAYFYIPEGFNLDGDGAMLASGTDEAVNSNPNSPINIFNNGTWGPLRTIDNVYSNLYEGLRKVNIFLANIAIAEIIPNAELTVMTPADTGYVAQIKRLNGEAYFLRALFHFELLKRFGAIPLATKVFQRDDNLNLPKNTFDECKDQIVKDCDSAIALLPTWTQTWSTTNRGRATKLASLALKSRLLLYAASPQYNIGNDISKWQVAANAAKAIIDSNRHSLISPYINIFNFSAAAYNNEVIFATRAQNINSIESNNAPISYDGAKGRTNPTQDFVDAFEMTNGRPITDATSGYNPSNPYTLRDPRLALTVIFNGANFKGRAVQTYVGGEDGLNKGVNATTTGYYMRKFLSESASWGPIAATNVRRPWVVFRYGEVLLNYAEALNEAQGPVADVYRFVNQVRARNGIAMPAIPTVPGISKDSMRIRIKNERRVELCFEGHRFYDVRRWGKADLSLNKSVTGMRITPNANGTLNYQRFEVETRVFSAKNYLYPFSQNDINLQPALIQNTGY